MTSPPLDVAYGVTLACQLCEHSTYMVLPLRRTVTDTRHVVADDLINIVIKCKLILTSKLMILSYIHRVTWSLLYSTLTSTASLQQQKYSSNSSSRGSQL
jgi:hypothetical protein